MKCPFCNHIEDKVIDSRLSQDDDVTRRRRECLKCGKRFTTYERVEEALPLVIKKDGRRELFDRTKILNGILRACEKRPVGIEAIEKVVGKIEKGFIETGEKEIQSSAIGAAVMEEIKTLDEVAYVRFASVYREFRDINEFMKELKGLLEVKPVRKDRALNPTLPERNIISSQSSKSLRSGLSNGVNKKKK